MCRIEGGGYTAASAHVIGSFVTQNSNQRVAFLEILVKAQFSQAATLDHIDAIDLPSVKRFREAAGPRPPLKWLGGNFKLKGQ
jgi:hypothetical protein